MKHSNKWFQIRYDLYCHLRARVQQRLGPELRELKVYGQNLEREFAGPWKATTTEHLMKSIRNHQIIMMADFHALKQSQKTHLRILKKLPSKENIILALECIGAEHQKQIDLFLQGRLSQKSFLEKVKWGSSWGFPWENYLPLFEWAQYHGVRIYGLNAPDKTKMGVKKRDQYAAKIIENIHAEDPKSKIFVIFGELHLAKKHLPQILFKKGYKPLRIFQNSEKIYFKLIKSRRRKEVDLVQMNPSTFCVLNVPPWVKWQSYLMFIEKTYDAGLDESIDYTDHVTSYVKLLSKELRLKVPLSDLSVYSAEDGNFWRTLTGLTSASERRWVERFIDEEVSFFLPMSGIGFLSRGSVNQAAGLGMEYIISKLSGADKNLLEFPTHFLAWVWIKAWAYFGTKLINPRRKTNTLLDMRARLTSRRGKIDREPLQLALSYKIYELIMISRGQKYKLKLKPQRPGSYLIAAELLGGLMGEKIYQAYKLKKLSLKEIRRLMSVALDAKSFPQTYFDFVRVLEAIPVSFQSKEEKI